MATSTPTAVTPSNYGPYSSQIASLQQQQAAVPGQYTQGFNLLNQQQTQTQQSYADQLNQLQQNTATNQTAALGGMKSQQAAAGVGQVQGSPEQAAQQGLVNQYQQYLQQGTSSLEDQQNSALNQIAQSAFNLQGQEQTAEQSIGNQISGLVSQYGVNLSNEDIAIINAQAENSANTAMAAEFKASQTPTGSTLPASSFNPSNTDYSQYLAGITKSANGGYNLSSLVQKNPSLTLQAKNNGVDLANATPQQAAQILALGILGGQNISRSTVNNYSDTYNKTVQSLLNNLSGIGASAQTNTPQPGIPAAAYSNYNPSASNTSQSQNSSTESGSTNDNLSSIQKMLAGALSYNPYSNTNGGQ